MVSDAQAYCQRTKNAALYLYDASIDGYVLQYLFDDGVDVGLDPPPGYEVMTDTWVFDPPPRWDGSYPVAQLHDEPPDVSSEDEVTASLPDTIANAQPCRTLPGTVTHGRRFGPDGSALPIFIARAPRHPTPNNDPWFEPIAQREHQGIDSPSHSCSDDDATLNGVCRDSCRLLSFWTGEGARCKVRIYDGTQNLICVRTESEPQSTAAWVKHSCENP